MTLNTGRMMPRMRSTMTASGSISRHANRNGGEDRKKIGAGSWRLQNVLRQVVVLDDPGEPFVHVGGIDRDRAAIEPGGAERDLVQQPLHDRVQPPCADVLLFFVDRVGDFGKS